jgi:UDP-glucose 4-epimerase
MRVLVTGGTGFIGSHTCVSLIEVGHEPVVLDNLCNSSSESLARVHELTGYRVPFIEADARDEETVLQVLRDHEIDAVIHFAGLKSVAESVRERERYINNNVGSTAAVARAMHQANVGTFIFSSSASVYGLGCSGMVEEDAPTVPANPYAESKLMAEQLLTERAQEFGLRVGLLRYFNPVGAHPSGRMGEDPNGIPNNLMPYVCQVAVGRREKLSIYGKDYPTPDGTGVRDYIHVMDLAEGHVAALHHFHRQKPGTVKILNLGTGKGTSVLDIVHTFERVNGVSIPCEIVGRRPGDVAAYYAGPARAIITLAWSCKRSIDDMCRDAWHWQRQNPNGYRAAPDILETH